jgi:eukaryotic-like serine/threonine-protein kinase
LKTRLRDIGEARILLANVQAGSPAVAEQPGHPRPRWLAWGIAVLLFLIAAALALLRFRDVPQQARAIHTTLLPPDNAQFEFTTPYPLPAISPDGSHIVFGAKTKDGKTQLWLRRLDSPTARPLPGTENSGTPFWSPDSRWVAFGQERKLKKIDTHGGPPVHIADLPALWLMGGSWNTDGTIILGINSPSPILRVEASGGTPLPVTGSATTLQRFPSFLPDGRHFVYTNAQAGEMPVQIGSLDEPGKPGKKVAETTSAAVYAQGHILYLRDRTLIAQPFDHRRVEVKGEAVPIAEGVPTYGRHFRAPGFAVSPDGLLVYAYEGSAKPRLVWRDRQGKVLGSLDESLTGSIESIELSPDAKKVAVTVYNPEGDIWICDTTRGVPARFTFDPQRDRSPIWSADGNLLYFASNRHGRFDIYRKAVNGATSEELLLGHSAEFKFPNSVSPDGKLLLYAGTAQQTTFDMWVLPLTHEKQQKVESQLFLQTPFTEWRGQFRRDGNWIAYVSNETGQFQVYVAPFPGPGGKRQVSANGGLYPRWRKDGKELFFVALTGELMAAEVVDRSGTLEVGRIHRWFDGFSIGTDDATYDISADGQKILVVDSGSSMTQTLSVLQNWTALLRK